MRCASPPLNSPQFLSHSSSSIPHSLATSIGPPKSDLGTPFALFPELGALLELLELEELLSDLENQLDLVERELKDEIVLRKSRGVPGRREGRWGT